MHYVYEIQIGPNKQIGSTSYIEKRMSKHKNSLEKNCHWNYYMQNSFNKYKNFSYTILSEWKTRKEAFLEGQKLLDSFYGKYGYMMLSKKAVGASHDSEYIKYWKNKKLPFDMKKKISESQKGRKLSEDIKNKISESLKGKTKSDETKNKMKGPKSDNMIKKLSEYSKNRSIIHRQNLSKSNIGKKLSEDTKKKISKSQKGISKLANAKRVYQYNIKGNLIAEFESVAKAAKVLGLSISAISNAAIGKSKSSAGFIWKYKN